MRERNEVCGRLDGRADPGTTAPRVSATQAGGRLVVRLQQLRFPRTSAANDPRGGTAPASQHGTHRSRLSRKHSGQKSFRRGTAGWGTSDVEFLRPTVRIDARPHGNYRSVNTSSQAIPPSDGTRPPLLRDATDARYHKSAEWWFAHRPGRQLDVGAARRGGAPGFERGGRPPAGEIGAPRSDLDEIPTGAAGCRASSADCRRPYPPACRSRGSGARGSRLA